MLGDQTLEPDQRWLWADCDILTWAVIRFNILVIPGLTRPTAPVHGTTMRANIIVLIQWDLA